MRHPVPATTNPLGVKGVGEAGTTASLAAIMNAIADAVPMAPPPHGHAGDDGEGLAGVSGRRRGKRYACEMNFLFV